MSSYSVVWTMDAREELARIWMESEKRAAITAAVHRIDNRLASQPTEGRELREGLFKIVDAPIIVFYEVASDDRRVTVEAVWLS